jgi:hypothetical protein
MDSSTELDNLNGKIRLNYIGICGQIILLNSS